MGNRDIHEMTILMVDDDPLNLKSIQQMLNSGGYENVLTADSGERGLELVKEHAPDIILSVIMMPGMDGFEFCRRIRANESERHIPIIFMTAMTDEDAISKSIDPGATDFISKPISRIEILSRVRSALTLKRSFDRLEEELMRRKEAENKIGEQKELLTEAYNQLETVHQRLQRDYEIAAEVFSRVASTHYSGFSNIRYVSAPLSTVGGDLLLIAPTPSGGLHLLLGDFTGHGLSAAIGAIPVSGIFHRMSEKGYCINEIIAETNSKLKAILPTGLFFCACFVTLNSSYNKLTIWNGGLPDVLLIGAQGGIKQRFPSTNLPLGVVDTYHLDRKGQCVDVDSEDLVYVYSDGVIDARNPQGEIYGQERFENHFHPCAAHRDLFDEILADLKTFQGESLQSDDFILAEIKCGAPDECAIKRASGCGMKSPGWKMSLELGRDHLRCDPLPFVVNMLMGVTEISEHKEDVCLILSELYTNALDYGVLGLDPELKWTPDGFDRYYALRQEALETLETGWIKIDLEFTPEPKESKLVFRVEDSGSGFNQCSLVSLPENTTCGGRGVQLVRSLCRSLGYNEQGNCAEATFIWQ